MWTDAVNIELDQLRKLPAADKPRIVEESWDDIATSDEQLILRDWHLRDWHIAEAQRRDTELDADPGIALTREQLWKRS